VICRKRQKAESEQEDITLPNCLYMWGSNKYGQLGLWDFEDRPTPQFIDTDFDPVNVSCGD
jgi:alpha-tubulin suppressor-like RCC1 family protein